MVEALAIIGVIALWFGVGYIVELSLERVIWRHGWRPKPNWLLGWIETVFVYGPGGVAVRAYEAYEHSRFRRRLRARLRLAKARSRWKQQEKIWKAAARPDGIYGTGGSAIPGYDEKRGKMWRRRDRCRQELEAAEKDWELLR